MLTGDGSVVCDSCLIAEGPWLRTKGLLGRDELPDGEGILLRPASSIHMAFIVVFLNLWGLVFHEWRGTSQKTKSLVWVGILILIVSTIVIGVGNKLAVAEGDSTPVAVEIEAP